MRLLSARSLFPLALIATGALAIAAPEAEVQPAAAITALEVQPAKVAIHGFVESAQVLVTAKLADGTTADVTRLATLKATGDVAEISPAGLITPKKNGAKASSN